MAPQRATFRSAARNYRRCWKDLALTDVTYKLLAFVVLTPIVGLLFRVLIALSGRTVVADEDIVRFFLEPLGWICLVCVGALWTAIVALEQAALMVEVCATDAQQRMGVLPALRFAVVKSWAIFRVTIRIMALALLASLPFLAGAGIAYLTLLTKFDINFYLTQKPIEFQIAVGIAAVLGTGLAIVLLKLATNWFYALPLVIFEDTHPRKALRVSRDRVQGHRGTILKWIIMWLLATFVVSALATSAVTVIAQWSVPRAHGSLSFLLLVVGATMLAWIVINLAMNLVATTTFATLFYQLYADLGRPSDVSRFQLEAVDRADQSRFMLTPRRLVIGAFVAVLVSGAIGVIAIQSVKTDDDVLVIAHRGASAAAPENTIASIKQAIEEKADWVEIDVQETADDVVVVFHDRDFKKIADVDLNIWDATMEDLKTIDIGSWFDAKFKDQRVPTLAQVLDCCKGKARVTIELKYYENDRQLEQRVVEVVEKQAMESDVVIISLKQSGLQKIKQLRPSWQTGLLTAVALGDLTQVDADFLAVNAGIATRSFIRNAHEKNKKVVVWTVNDPVTMSTMIGRGVDGLITDRPALAHKVLEERKGMSSVERLLIELASVLGVKTEIAEQ